jgi:5-methylcytosine-specific restriction protein B
MARYCGSDRSEAVLAAAERWRDEGLKRDGSVFTDASLWREEHLAALQTHFIDAPDEGEGAFFEKLEGQLSGTGPAVKQLAAEMLWVMFLCPSNMRPQKKRENVLLVWGWSKAPTDPPEQWMRDEVLEGVGSAGTSYGFHRWRELAFFIRLVRGFKALSEDERSVLLNDGWKFAEWLEKLPEAAVRQFRHMVLFLLFPDSFERTFGGGHRRLIVQNFSGMSRARVRALSPLQIDRELARIRVAEQQKMPDKPLDFYESPLKEQWQAEDFDAHTAGIEREDVLAALREIDEKGIPADAESTIYDLIHGTRRYPPKLVLSFASKHAGGNEFDRALFSGGIGSPAFNLLRSLGFHIERKDFLPALLKQFLGQASEGTSLIVKGYPDSYRGLDVRVSFGKGTLARVPWIAFLGYEQETKKGIFPVLLYYKADATLVLARGISDIAAPGVSWPTGASTQTIDQYFVEHFSRSAERYGESFVFKAYRVPSEIREDVIASDLDTLIAQYHDLMGALRPLAEPAPEPRPVAPIPPRPAPTASEPLPERPYSVKEASEALFISQERFEEILAVWRQKKNLVVQGPPGVGKTFFYRRLAYALMGADAPSRLTTVQFHPSYAYEDFVQGYRPSESGFTLRNGVFHRFCERARGDTGHLYVFVIDEINRGNLAKVFGELLMLLETDKRGPDWAVPLAYSAPDSMPFFIPANVYVLGLMNTADRSLAVVDYALRRRFAFVNLGPEFSSSRFKEHLAEKGVSEALRQKIIARMTELNDQIARDSANLGPGFCIGHSFFCDPPEEAARHAEWYRQVVDAEVAPLLREYYFDDIERAEKLIRALI